VFYSSILNLLSLKEITVIFANIEDILLTNTAFVSSLEERQKDCRLYVDEVGDILLKHIPSMGVYLVSPLFLVVVNCHRNDGLAAAILCKPRYGD
jgi:hypothetical protein